jgi:hypothetical protein
LGKNKDIGKKLVTHAIRRSWTFIQMVGTSR